MFNQVFNAVTLLYLMQPKSKFKAVGHKEPGNHHRQQVDIQRQAGNKQYPDNNRYDTIRDIIQAGNFQLNGPGQNHQHTGYNQQDKRHLPVILINIPPEQVKKYHQQHQHQAGQHHLPQKNLLAVADNRSIFLISRTQ